MAFAASANADGVKVGGAIQGGYSWTGNDTASGTALRGAYFDFSGDFGRSSFMIDVPFTTAGTFGLANSQAWIMHKAESGFRWKVGQFDSMFGFEPIDVVSNYFASNGVIRSGSMTLSPGVTVAHMPTRHTGWTLGYGTGSWGIDVIVANTRDTNGPVKDVFWDYGFKFGYMADKTNIGLGFLYNGQTNNNYMLIDAMAGFGMSKMQLDLEVFYKSFQTASTVASTTLGAMARTVFGLSEAWDLGVRVEFLSATPAGGTATTTIAGALGPNWNLSKNTLVKFQYGLNSTSATGSSALTHAVFIDGVLRI